MKPHEAKKAAKRALVGTHSDSGFADEIDRQLLAYCHPHQRDGVLDPSRWITFLVGRGGTKTTTMRIRLIRKLARIQNARLVYCASSRPMAEELMWLPLKDTIESLGLVAGEDVEFNETKLRCTFLWTGATLRLVGVADRKEVDKLRGQPFHEVALDEASIYPPELLDNLVHRVVEPRLGDYLGCLVMGGTPSHILRGLFYDTTRQGSPLHRPYADRDKPEHVAFTGWSSHAWSLADVAELPEAKERYPALVNLWSDALAKKKQNQWSDDNPTWKREYLGLWAADDTETVFKYRPHVEGQPWNEWDPFGNEKLEGLLALKAAIAKLPEGVGTWHYVIGQDMGHSDPYACNVFAFAPADPSRTIWHVFSFERQQMHARPIAELLIGGDAVMRALTHGRVEPYAGLFGLTGWPDAMVMDSDEATLVELRNVYGISIAKAEKKRDYKHGAIELVNGELIDGRLKILKGSPLAVQLGELQWAEDMWGNLVENKAQANHSTDCLIYARMAIATLFETGAVDRTPPKGGGGEGAGGPVFDVRPKAEYEDALGAPDETYDDIFGGGF